MDERPCVTADQIAAGLRRLGLGPGDVVLVHSSLRSFGYVEGGADAVVDALLDVVGPGGTLCMPALSWGHYSPEKPPPLFDPRTTPGNVGRIPETFRMRPSVLRSLHPTHSMAALGPLAGRILAGHERSETPCGPDSPWGRLCYNEAWVLMIGCGTGPMTLSHGPEEVLHRDVRCTPPIRCALRTDAGVQTVTLRLHAADYDRPGPGRKELRAVLEQRGLLWSERVGMSELLMMRASDVWDLFMEWCATYPARRKPS